MKKQQRKKDERVGQSSRPSSGEKDGLTDQLARPFFFAVFSL